MSSVFAAEWTEHEEALARYLIASPSAEAREAAWNAADQEAREAALAMARGWWSNAWGAVKNVAKKAYNVGKGFVKSQIQEFKDDPVGAIAQLAL